MGPNKCKRRSEIGNQPIPRRVVAGAQIVWSDQDLQPDAGHGPRGDVADLVAKNDGVAEVEIEIGAACKIMPGFGLRHG